jgi:hypothetical protein
MMSMFLVFHTLIVCKTFHVGVAIHHHNAFKLRTLLLIVRVIVCGWEWIAATVQA